MKQNSRIYVAGHRGLAGSALLRSLQKKGFCNFILRTHAELDLFDRSAVWKFFEDERPEYVFLAAAKVGGILANSTLPASFIRDNLLIQENVIEASQQFDVKRLLFLGSSCIYPKLAPQPMKEEYLLTGTLEPTNRPYALAKIAGIEMCWAFNRQYGTQYVAAMPTNLYGPNDNYDLATSHVLPALLRKIHEAKITGAPEATVWGTGTVLREFLHSDDMADACVFLMNLSDEAYRPIVQSESEAPLFNVGCGRDISIRGLAELIRDVAGYSGRLVFDSTKPDGAPRKLLDISRLQRLGWQPRISLRDGVVAVYKEFVDTYPTIHAGQSR